MRIEDTSSGQYWNEEVLPSRRCSLCLKVTAVALLLFTAVVPVFGSSLNQTALPSCALTVAGEMHRMAPSLLFFKNSDYLQYYMTKIFKKGISCFMKTFLSALFIFLWSNSSIDAGWSAPQTISTTGANNDNQVNMSTDVGADGFAVAAWSALDGSVHRIQVATLPKGGSWSSPLFISPVTGVDATAPQVAVDPSDNAVVVWNGFDGTGAAAQARSYVGGVWGAITNLSAAGTNGANPDVGLDSSGNGVAVWQGFNGSNNVIRSRSYVGGVWLPLTTDISATGNNAFGSSVAVDASGNAVAVWLRFNGSNNIVQSSSYVGGVWGPVTDLSAAGQFATNPHVVIDSLGNAVAIWERSNGSNIIIQSRSNIGGVWGPVTNLSATGLNANRSQVAINPSSGNAVAIWDTFNGSNFVVQSRSYVGGVWAAIMQASASGQDSVLSGVGVDSSGNAIAIWINSASNLIIQTASLPFGGSWSSILDISTAGQNSSQPVIAEDSTGYAVVTWLNNTLSHVIQAVTFTATPTPPTPGTPSRPKKFHAKVHRKNLPHDKFYRMRTKWRASSSSNVVAYRIYENNKLIKVLSASKLKFRKNIFTLKRLNRRYQLTAVSNTGVESARTHITKVKKK